MSEEDICKLIPMVILLIIGIVFGVQFYRLFKINDECNDVWDKLMKKIDEIENEE